MTTFNSTYAHLNIPDQWNEYFSKYPNGYTILEAVINWAGQVNDMTDTLNSTTDYVNNFMSTFDTDLDATVLAQLQAWQADGTLDTIITQALQTDLGDITKLTTTDKSSAVNALNEVNGRLSATIQQLVNVKNPPVPLVAAKGDGVTDDSTPIQAVNDYLSQNGGGVLFIPKGTFIGNIIVDSNVYIKGAGVKTTILKSAPNSNKDVIQGRNFLTLTGTAKQTPENRGVRYAGIKDIMVDGNRANNTSGYGIRIWGCSWHWDNVLVQNCVNDGIWTEFSDIDAPTGESDPSHEALESFYTNIKTINNGGDGWKYNGPHDSSIINFVTYGNSGWGLNQVKGSLTGHLWNSWLNTLGSFNVGDSLICYHMQATGANIGTGIQIGAIGNVDLNVYVAGHQTGIIIGGTNVRINGNLINNVGDAVQFNGSTNVSLHLTGSGNGNVINFSGTKHGVNTIIANFDVPSGKTLYTGNVPSGDFVVISSAEGTKVFNIPTTTLSVGGYNPVLPLSNGTILTDANAPSPTKRGAVFQQPAPVNLTAAPTASDFNNLIQLLKYTGILA